QPTVFYRWQKEFFENGAAAFQQRGRTNHQPEQERIAYLEKKVILVVSDAPAARVRRAGIGLRGNKPISSQQLPNPQKDKYSTNYTDSQQYSNRAIPLLSNLEISNPRSS
ncbi:MAG: hypothetical protein WBL99_09335, partial [Candidatus Acidiferrales bacterium]